MKHQIDVAQTRHIIAIETDQLFQSLGSGFLRVKSSSHGLHTRMGAGDLDVFFSVAGHTRAANVWIEIDSGADDGRIAKPTLDLPRQSGCADRRRHLALFVERDARDGAGRGIQYLRNRVLAPFRLDADLSGNIVQAL